MYSLQMSFGLRKIQHGRDASLLADPDKSGEIQKVRWNHKINKFFIWFPHPVSPLSSSTLFSFSSFFSRILSVSSFLSLHLSLSLSLSLSPGSLLLSPNCFYTSFHFDRSHRCVNCICISSERTELPINTFYMLQTGTHRGESVVDTMPVISYDEWWLENGKW